MVGVPDDRARYLGPQGRQLHALWHPGDLSQTHSFGHAINGDEDTEPLAADDLSCDQSLSARSCQKPDAQGCCRHRVGDVIARAVSRDDDSGPVGGPGHAAVTRHPQNRACL